jgi:carbonic anhydrase/acetyltransferase-like protein (isoleucine patch superfamily)
MCAMIYNLETASPAFAGEYFVADSAAVIGKVNAGDQVSVWFNAVVRADNEPINIGNRCNIQDGAVLHNDPGYPLTMDEGVSVGHLAMLHGCTIGANTLIGMKAVVLNGAVIGRDCLIGAGSLITGNKVIPDGSMVMGAPARVIRPLNEEEIADLKRVTESYVKRSRRYRAHLSAALIPSYR